MTKKSSKKKKNTKDLRDIIIKIILIVIIIILLIHNCCLINSRKNNIPTGNVDIFEISCDKDSCDENKKGNVIGDVTIGDKDITWKSTNKLRIFTNPVYNMEEKIAPEDSNIYQFVIKNNTNANVKYSINFVESNPYNINMRYKLKKGDKYIIDDYVSYNQLKQTDIKLDKNNSDTYYLEWKWVSSDNDTEAASLENAYSISIEIDAESVYE